MQITIIEMINFKLLKKNPKKYSKIIQVELKELTI